jgi:hypothetical protein
MGGYSPGRKILIDLMATALAPLHFTRDNYALGELATQTEELESTVLTLNKGRNMKRRNKT